MFTITAFIASPALLLFAGRGYPEKVPIKVFLDCFAKSARKINFVN
jgi:hypothetical protein